MGKEKPNTHSIKEKRIKSNFEEKQISGLLKEIYSLNFISLDIKLISILFVGTSRFIYFSFQKFVFTINCFNKCIVKDLQYPLKVKFLYFNRDSAKEYITIISEEITY